MFLLLLAVAAAAPRNLCSGPPADPLLPVRDNSPSAAEMAEHPRRHPYLFFDEASRDALRERATSGPLHGPADRVIAEAEKDLRVPIPPPARVYEGIPRFLPNGSFNPEEEKHHYDDFYDQSKLMKVVLPELALAYQITGDPRFGDAAKAWLMNFAGRAKLARKDRDADFDAAWVAFGLGLGYDWLWDRLNDAERLEVQAAITRVALPIVARGTDLLGRSDPQRIRASYGGNHQSRTFGLFGLASLSVLYEVREAPAWLDMDIRLMRDRIFPSEWAPDGEYVDGWDHFDSSLDDPLPFVVALKRMGGEDLFHDPRLEPRFRGIPRYFLYGLENRSSGPSSYDGWLALAAGLDDGTAQWIAARNGGLDRVDPVFAVLFYDPAVKPEPPVDPPGSVYFPYSGMVKLCSDWGPHGVLLPFRCGPVIGKELGDQNGFRLRAGGEWLLPRLRTEWPLTAPPIDYHWALEGWFRGAAQNVIVAEPEKVGDFATFERTGKVPMLGGTQYAAWDAPAHLAGNQWLSGPDVPKNGDLRTVQFDPALDYVCGEAHRAYFRYPPSLWVRHVLFVKGGASGPPSYILVCDEVEAGAKPDTFAWQLMSGPPFTLNDHAIAIRGKRAALDVRFLAPEEDRIVSKETPAPEADRTPYIQWTTPGPERRCFYLTALVPRIGGEARPISFHVLPAAGGWAVEIDSAAGRDVALFRSEQARSVAAGAASTDSSAALFRTPVSGPTRFYKLGQPTL